MRKIKEAGVTMILEIAVIGIAIFLGFVAGYHYRERAAE